MSCCWIFRVREFRNLRIIDEENPFTKIYLPLELHGHIRSPRTRLVEGRIMLDIGRRSLTPGSALR
jgi:hypothetical protein